MDDDDVTALDDELVFNGVDGTTGGYLHAATSLSALAGAILGEEFPKDAVPELKYHNKQPHFGVVYGVDAEDLSDSGWALVAADDTPESILAALAPLRHLRSQQAGARYREFVHDEGYRRPEDKRAFLARMGMASALPANPEKVPYYVLLVGGPESIPFSFQYQLDVQYAVGRIAFDGVDDYRRYAEAVVAADEAQVPRTVRLFGPRNAADRATQLSATRLVAPLEQSLREKEPAWDVAAIAADDSDKRTLRDLLSGGQLGLLFTASHGVGFPRGHADQRSAQGALVCQDWPGPLLSGGQLADDVYFAGVDAAKLPEVRTRIMMSFACFGAGTPMHDDFPHSPSTATSVLADPPFVARLPQRLLAHPSGGMLAFVGHVERAWGCSFISHRVGPQHDVFLSALRALIGGRRIGHAMEFFDDRYSALTAELHEQLDGVRKSGDKPDARHMARLWTENNDARSYLLLGDPAVRLRQPLDAKGGGK